MRIVDKGRAMCAVAVPVKPTEVEQHSAKELVKYLKKISGARFAIRRGIPDQGPAVVVAEIGRTPFAGQRKMAPESILRAMDQGRFFLTGADPRGVLIGVYAFLRDELGCVFPQPAPADEFIPVKTTIDLSEKEYYHAPFLPVRYPVGWTGQVHEMDWYAKQGMSYGGSSLSDAAIFKQDQGEILSRKNGKILAKESIAVRGADGLYLGAHASEYLMPPAKYFDQHPEYFAYNPKQCTNGMRQVKDGRDSFGICWTNPDVIRIFTERILELFAAHPYLKVFTLMPNDGQPPCFCETCRKVEEPWEGVTTGLQYTKNYVLFASKICDVVVRKYPHARIEIASYSSHTELPKDFDALLPANLDVLVCVIERKFDRSFDDPPSPQEVKRTLANVETATEKDALKYTYYPKVFRKWAKHVRGRLRFYDYLTSTYGSMGMLFPISRASWRNIHYLKSAGFSGYGTQFHSYSGEDYLPHIWASYGVSHYITARASWDGKLSWEYLLQEYCRGFFREAAKPMVKYFTTLEDSSRRHRLSLGIPEILQIFDAPTYQACSRALAQAAGRARCAKYKTRIQDQQDLLEFGHLFWRIRQVELKMRAAVAITRRRVPAGTRFGCRYLPARPAAMAAMDSMFKLLEEHAALDDQVQKLFDKPLLNWGKRTGYLYYHLMGSTSDRRGVIDAMRLMKNAANAAKSLNYNAPWYAEE